MNFSIRSNLWKLVYFAFIGTGFLLWKWYDDAALDRHFATEAATTLGEVTGRSTHERDDGSRYWKLAVRYRPDPMAGVHIIDPIVTEETYRAHHAGDEIEVFYLPDDPQLGRVAGMAPPHESMAIIVAFVLSLGFGALIALRFVKEDPPPGEADDSASSL